MCIYDILRDLITLNLINSYFNYTLIIITRYFSGLSLTRFFVYIHRNSILSWYRILVQTKVDRVKENTAKMKSST